MSVKELLSNAEIVIGEEELTEKISKGQTLRVKFGVDPTRPDLTFGHMVVFNKLKQFQDAGHEAILLIGDYTARIGDPSGRSELRPELTAEEVNENAKTYLDQAFKILSPEKTIVRRNSEWFSKMNFADALNLTRKMTVARMLERDDFDKRFKENQPISMVEFMYPLIQGYDSIMLNSDIELGGSDQLFNMLVGRSLQKDRGESQQAVLTLPLLVGLDGVRKMSKSYDNYIAFNDSPRDMFGKTMSISDDAMWEYFRLLLLEGEDGLERMKNDHPMVVKKELARKLTALFYGDELAEKEYESFSQVFSQGEIPKEMDQILATDTGLEFPTILDALSLSDAFASKGEIRRLFKQGAIKINGEKIEDCDFKLDSISQEGIVVKAGKKIFLRILP
ncbi:MAG TPA: tyrosine--tRNA ligase [Opitutae bacterium]|jgi:tyrosyl-tRNA synthetase|nr:tyrosine--tRNA ligase [Opitutae bacterium]|tara:strand:- start:975 stop:2150 length:1176 start_codon:yes stop_codon:yes gene_type:complete